MTDELEAACERLARFEAGDHTDVRNDCDLHCLRAVVSRAYLADRDRRKREADERAKTTREPGSASWLGSLGFDWNGNYWVIPGVAWLTISGELHTPSRKVCDNANRGQVLDLLSALNIPIPQKPEVPCE